MTKRAFDKIMAGIDEARAYLDDGSADKKRYRVHVPEKGRREEDFARVLGLSQASFAATYGFAVSAVRDWETGPATAGTRAHAFCSRSSRKSRRPSRARWRGSRPHQSHLPSAHGQGASPPPGVPDPSTPRLALLVLGLVFLLMTLSRGMGETFTVFLLPISNTFGWDRAQTVSVYSIGALCVGLAGAVRRPAVRSLGAARRLRDRRRADRRGIFRRGLRAGALAVAALHRARGRPRQRVPRSGDRFAAGQPLVRPAPAHRAGDRRIVDWARASCCLFRSPRSSSITPAGAAPITSSAP